MSHVSIKVTRPMFLNGQRLEVDQVVNIKALDAVNAVSSGRALYMTETDAQAANEAQRSANTEACKPNNGVRSMYESPSRKW